LFGSGLHRKSGLAPFLDLRSLSFSRETITGMGCRQTMGNYTPTLTVVAVTL
jgi:hypothetical protein